MNIPASERVFATGVTGAGKSHALRKLFLSKCPRALIIDPLGEHAGTNGSAGRVYRANDVAGVLAAMKRAPKEGNQWQIIANIDPTAAVTLGSILTPNVIQNGNAYPLHVGGMALVLHELDLIAGASSPQSVESWWRRGRHTGLTILGDTQRPAGVKRIITAMSQWIIVCATDEPADLDYLKGCLPRAAWDRVSSLPFRELILYSRRDRRWFHFNSDYKTIASG